MDSKVAVVTGAASGIGFALAKVCCERGMNVVLADNDITALCDSVEQLTSNQNEVLGVVCDVSRIDSVRHLARQTMERFGRVDWLFNNAGICGQVGPLWEIPIEHFNKVMEVNCYGILNGIHVFLPFMTNVDSHIINSASMYGLITGSNLSPYIMSKHAIVALSESLYFDLKNEDKKINVSVTCPAFTNTQLMANSAPLHESETFEKYSSFFTHGKEAYAIAQQIITGVEQKQFYILPDLEVTEFYQQRLQDIQHGKHPSENRIEKELAY